MGEPEKNTGRFLRRLALIVVGAGIVVGLLALLWMTYFAGAIRSRIEDAKEKAELLKTEVDYAAIRSTANQLMDQATREGEISLSKGDSQMPANLQNLSEDDYQVYVGPGTFQIEFGSKLYSYGIYALPVGVVLQPWDDYTFSPVADGIWVYQEE